jgi:hypothetical protein
VVCGGFVAVADLVDVGSGFVSAEPVTIGVADTEVGEDVSVGGEVQEARMTTERIRTMS